MTNEKIIVSSNISFDDTAVGLMFEDATSFSQYIERRSIKEKTPCMTLVLDFCERRSIDVDDITDLISKPLKEKIKQEMIASGLKKRTEATLDDIDD